ncbi:MAG: ABC transporter ATP-binding protein, partial [Nitrospinae bacterium]|nr:ABC transporter ATP-binding protein [Nitrospinota bacterium]
YGPSVVLDIPALAVSAGEVLALIGPNGAGKSTLLRVLGLLQRPSDGEVRFNGARIDFRRSTLAWRRRMITIFQEPLLCNTTVFRNVALGLRLRGVPRQTILPRVEAWLHRLGILQHRRRQANTLSGGEAQRVNLARAFVLEPDAFLLDEPFAALDPPTRRALLQDLHQLLRETGVTTIFVTHDLTEVMSLADRVAVILGGRVVQLDTPEHVLTAPATEEVAAFVGLEGESLANTPSSP